LQALLKCLEGPALSPHTNIPDAVAFPLTAGTTMPAVAFFSTQLGLHLWAISEGHSYPAVDREQEGALHTDSRSSLIGKDFDRHIDILIGLIGYGESQRS
jgi:hypothetical protein